MRKNTVYIKWGLALIDDWNCMESYRTRDAMDGYIWRDCFLYQWFLRGNTRVSCKVKCNWNVMAWIWNSFDRTLSIYYVKNLPSFLSPWNRFQICYRLPRFTDEWGWSWLVESSLSSTSKSSWTISQGTQNDWQNISDQSTSAWQW